MIIEEIKKIESTPKKLREFGLVVGGVFAALGIIFFLRQKPHAVYFLVPGTALVLLGVLFPRILKPLQKAWMAIAILMGWVMTRLILSVIFYLTFTPIRFFLWITGKDLLDQTIDPNAASYWLLRPPGSGSRQDCERQF